MKVGAVLWVAFAAACQVPAYGQTEPVTVLGSSEFILRCAPRTSGVCAQIKTYLEQKDPGVVLTAEPATTRAPDMYMYSRHYVLDCWNKKPERPLACVEVHDKLSENKQ